MLMWICWHKGNPSQNIPPYKDALKGTDLVNQACGPALLSKIRSVMSQLPVPDAAKSDAENKALFLQAMSENMTLWTGKAMSSDHNSSLSCSRVYDIFKAYNLRNADPAVANAKKRARASIGEQPQPRQEQRRRVETGQQRLDDAFRSRGQLESRQPAGPAASSDRGPIPNSTASQPQSQTPQAPMNEPWIIDASDSPETVTSATGEVIHTLKGNRNRLSFLLHHNRHRRNENDRFEPFLRQFRLTMLATEADGNCLFHAIITCLKESQHNLMFAARFQDMLLDKNKEPWTASSLRQAVFEHLQSELATNDQVLRAMAIELGVDDYAEIRERVVAEYCAKYGEDGMFCGQAELLALTSLLKCSLNLCEMTEGLVFCFRILHFDCRNAADTLD